MAGTRTGTKSRRRVDVMGHGWHECMRWRRWRAGEVSFPAKAGEAARIKRAKTSSILPPKVLPRDSRAAGTSSQRHVSNLRVQVHMAQTSWCCYM
ncbi:hypothetical protein OPV22_018985 [Ensete ventricosum]|uniref:Uncharacterized protein n=1 Tax=Ensete ventricosum TaxID=4639 RepID=A0AAV8QX48_ENSVE|nr:hypothetical protein OPV22_018985 [Ensete ventricosum]